MGFMAWLRGIQLKVRRKRKSVQSECGEGRGDSLQESKQGVRLGAETRKLVQAWMVVGMGSTEASRTREVVTR